MRYVYPATAVCYSDDEVVVSFRDIPWCHTFGTDVADALTEAADALEEAIAGLLDDGEETPTPSQPLPGEYMVSLPVDTAAKAALTTALRASGMTQAGLARRLGVGHTVVRRMLDPRHRTSINRINQALRALGSEAVLEITASTRCQ